MPNIPIVVDSVGIIRDIPPSELAGGAWSRGQNVRFADGCVAKSGGIGSIFGTPTVAPAYLQPYSTSSAQLWLYASSTKIYNVSGGTHTDITRSSGGDYTATVGTWSGGVLGGIALLNNPADTPQYWAGTGNAANLTNWPASTTCKVMRPFKNTIIACNVTKSGTTYPHMVKWSHPADPGSIPASWDITNPVYDAGEVDLAETQGRITDALALGDTFYIYKEDGVYAMQYVGPPSVFRFQLVTKQAGALSLNCAAEFPGGHLVLGQGDVWVNSGAAPVSALDGKLRSWLFRTIDAQEYAKSFVVTNFLKNEVWVCYPEVGQTTCSQAIAWNYKTGAVGVIDLPNVSHGASGVIDEAAAASWDSQTGTWDSSSNVWNSTDFAKSASRLLFASSTNTKIFLAEYTLLNNGSEFTSFVERTDLHLGDESKVKTLTGIRPSIQAVTGTVIRIEVGASFSANGSVVWEPYGNFTVGTDTKFDCFTTGTHLAVRFTCASGTFKMSKYDLLVQVTGDY